MWFVKGEIWPISSYWWGKWRLFFFLQTLEGLWERWRQLVPLPGLQTSCKPPPQKNVLETRRVCMRTPTHSFHLLWFRQPSCWFPFLQWMLLSPRFVPQSLNEGQYVRKKEFAQTQCSAAQRNIKEPSSLSHPRSHEDAEQGISTSKWKTGSGVKYHETNQSASCQKWISSLIKIQISGDVLLSAQGEDQQGSCWTHGSRPNTTTTSMLITSIGGANERAGWVWPQSAV